MTRYVAGFVWVRGAAATGTGPDVLITASSTPPPGYFAPTAGTVTLSVADGNITRAPDSETFDMASDGNAIIAVVTANSTSSTGPFNVSVSASGLEFNGNPRSFTTANVSLGLPANTGTTLALAVGTPPTPPLQPGLPASIQVLIRDREGNPGTSTNPFAPPPATGATFTAGTLFDLAVAVFDADGTAITGLTPTFTSSLSNIVVTSAGQLDVQGGGTEGASATITTSITGNTVSTSFSGTYTYGSTASVEFTAASSTLLWDTTAPTPATVAMLATVENEYGVPIPGITVNFTGDNITSNNWNAPATGQAFAISSGTTNASGQVTVALSAPTSAPGNSTTIANNPPKGANVLTATAGSASDSVTITIVRPLASLAVDGPSRLDVGTSGTYTVSSGVDVDGVNIASPSGTVAWSITNTTASGNIGNPDDLSPQVGSTATINATTGVVSPGPTAGEATVTATIGSVSGTKTVQIHGAPTKLVYTPATTATGYTGTAGSTLEFVVEFVDNWGRTVPLSELTQTTTASTNSASNSNVAPTGDPQEFVLTFGTVGTGGQMTVSASGNWKGASGTLNVPFSLTRATDLNN